MQKIINMEESKKVQEIIEQWQALQPLCDNDKAKLSRKFSIDFNYNSNHIEGNTLTYGQTELLLLFGKVVDEAEMKDLEDMKAHSVCLKMMEMESDELQKPLTEMFIRQLHKIMLREDYNVYRQLLGGVQTSYTIHAGCYKTRPNSVITRYGGRFEYASPEETSALMTDLVNWYNDAEQNGNYTPIQLAALFHYRYIRIHPFEDGNGRIARLLVNFILARHNYPMIVVRSRKKEKYYEALHKTDLKVGPVPAVGANATLDEIKYFLRYFENLFCDEVMNNISFLNEHDAMVWWFDGEMVKFRSPNTPKLLDFLQEQPDITINELCNKLNINRSAIQKQLELLKTKGYIVQSNEKGGNWHVVITSSI